MTERTSVRTLGDGESDTKKGKGGESRECSFEARMGEFSLRETFVQPAFIGDEQRYKEQERAREKRRRNLRNLRDESLERSQGGRRR